MLKGKFRGKIFTKLYHTSYITQKDDDTPVFEEEIRTYKIEKDIRKKQERYIIYELHKNKKIRKKTVRARKDDTYNKVINRVQAENIKINQRYKIRIGKRTTLVQTNYRFRAKKFMQLLCVFQIDDIRRGISDHFIGFSKKVPMPTKDDIENMINDCESMAVGKFISRYGKAKKSSDIATILIEKRYQYHAKKF